MSPPTNSNENRLPAIRNRASHGPATEVHTPWSWSRSDRVFASAGATAGMARLLSRTGGEVGGRRTMGIGPPGIRDRWVQFRQSAVRAGTGRIITQRPGVATEYWAWGTGPRGLRRAGVIGQAASAALTCPCP